MSTSVASLCNANCEANRAAAIDPLQFTDALKQLVGEPLTIRLNENRSTMISVRKDDSGLRVSLHRMFLTAPDDVMGALVKYLQGKLRRPGPILRAFIDQSYQQLDYSQDIDKSRLDVCGKAHNLLSIYDGVNAEYFDGSLGLGITWYGNCERKTKRRFTFGLYFDALRLIKVHRRLDRPEVPEELIAYVVYHEMLHHVLPAYVDDNGKRRIHHPEFLRREKEFEYYQEASDWIENNQRFLFG